MAATVVLNKSEKISSEIESKNQDDLSRRAAVAQITASFLASLSVTSAGIGLGYPAITTQLLSREDADIVLNASEISWFASITAIACPIGSLLSGFLSEKVGRRNTLLFVNIISTISWVVIGFSSRNNVQLFFIELMIGRALIGISIGMITTPSIMYCSEVCHPKIRGLMTVLSTPFFVAFGTLLAYLLGYMIPSDFRLVSVISAGVTVGTFLILFFIPESPVYLITTNKTEKARRALAKFRNLKKNDLKIDSEIQKIEESRNTTTEKLSFFGRLKEFKKPELYQPFLIMVSFFTVQQFSGIFVILVYAAQFSIEAGVTMDAFLSAVIVGVIRCLTTILVGFASDKFGRRPMTITSGIGMFVSLLGITLCAAFPNSGVDLSFLPATFLFIFVFSGTIGFLTLPFAMVAEMYPQKSRGFAAGITMSINFLMSFIHVKLFFTVFEYFGNIVIFGFYTFVSLVGVLFAIFILPETKGKTLLEIEQYFKNK